MCGGGGGGGVRTAMGRCFDDGNGRESATRLVSLRDRTAS